MRQKELPERSCCTDFCSAFCCTILCVPNSIVSIPFKVIVDILSTFIAPCSNEPTACYATRHEINFWKELRTRANNNPHYEYYGNKTYNIVDGLCAEDWAGTCAAPCANSLFAFDGMRQAIKDKVQGKYGLSENERLVNHTNTSIQ